MKNSFFIILCLSILVSCQSPYHAPIKKQIEEVYIASGAEQYFLPELPAWANVSRVSDCRRMDNIRFLDFSKLNKSYNLDLEKLIQLQLTYNNNLKRIVVDFDKIDRYSTSKKDEEILFYNSLDKIQGGVKEFLSPEFKQIHLVWIDDFVIDPTGIIRLKNLLKSSTFSAGFPVFVSNCLSSREMERFLIDNQLEELNIKLISSDFLTPFKEDLSLGIHLVMHFGVLFKDSQMVYIYSTKNMIPAEFKGPLKLKKF